MVRRKGEGTGVEGLGIRARGMGGGSVAWVERQGNSGELYL
jgi:hypothetical protein